MDRHKRWMRAGKASAAEGVLLFLAVVVVCATTRPVFSNTATSRLATVLSLSEGEGGYLDRPLDRPPNPYERVTVDKVRVDGRILSSKPPLLSLAMAGEYWVLSKLTGWDIAEKRDATRLLTVFTYTFVGVPFLFSLALFSRALAFWAVGPAARAYVLGALAFGTQFGGYATTFNNQVPAAALLVAGLYLTTGIVSGAALAAPLRFSAVGMCTALAFTIDLPTGILGLALWYGVTRNAGLKALVWLGLGALAPLIVHFAATILLTGSPLPVQVSKTPFLFEDSYWRQPVGKDALNEPKGTYVFNLLLGRSGIFLLYPVLLLGPIALLMQNKARWMPRTTLLKAMALVTALFILYYATISNNYGGVAYGGRWFIAAMPYLLWMAAPLVNRFRRRWQWGMALVLLAVSIYSAWECSVHPWSANQEWTTNLFGAS